MTGDGIIGIDDVNTIIGLVFDSSALEPGSALFQAADIIYDGVIDIADVVAAINLYVYGSIIGDR